MKLSEIKTTARVMLDELQAGSLEVAKVPIENGYKRVVCNQNTEWYREFCNDHISYKHGRFRRPRTFIKRRDTERALTRIMEGKLNSVYAVRLLPYVEKFWQENQRKKRHVQQREFSVCTNDF